MRTISAVALLAAIPISRSAHLAADETNDTLPTCDVLGIPQTRSCISHCGSIGYDGATPPTGSVGSPGSNFWSIPGLGDTCKCKTSPPGTAYDENQYAIVCHTPPHLFSEGGNESPNYENSQMEEKRAESELELVESSELDRLGSEQPATSGSSMGGHNAAVTIVTIAVVGAAVVEIAFAALL